MNLKQNYSFKNKIHNISFSFILGGNDVMSNFPLLYEENIEGVAFSQDLTQKAFNLQNFPHKRLAFTKDRLFMYSPVFLFRKKSMLTEVFDKQLNTLQETGLIDFWIKNYTFHRNQKIKKREPSKLRMENIIAVFEICALMYTISFLVFIFEILSRKCRYIQYILDYITN